MKNSKWEIYLFKKKNLEEKIPLLDPAPQNASKNLTKPLVTFYGN